VQALYELYRSRKEKVLRSWSEVRRILEKEVPVTAVYDRYRYDKEKRAALEKWAAVLTDILDMKPAPTAAPARPVARADVYEFRRQRAAAPAGLVTGRTAGPTTSRPPA
jgi:hypothetical protein